MQFTRKHTALHALSALAALTLCAAQSARAQETVLINTFGPGDIYSTNANSVNGQGDINPVVTANSFTVTSSSVTLDTITLPMQYGYLGTGTNTFDLDVETSVPFSSTSNILKPSGVSLEYFQVTGQMAAYGTPDAAITVTSATHPLLQSGETYWVVASVPDSTVEADWMAEVISDTTPYGLAQRNPAGGVWGYGAGHDAFRVTGLAAAPEPSQSAALGIGLFGLCGLILRARKRRTA